MVELMVVVQVRVADLEIREVVVRHVVVEMDLKGLVANCPSLTHKGYLVTFLVEEVLEVLVWKVEGGLNSLQVDSWRRGGESFWKRGDDFRVDVLRFHTCLTDILGFLEKLEW
ncbi:hypothetical protein Tco_0722011 [Tanacetum coccineum]